MERYLAETTSDVDYANEISLLSDTPTQAESLLQATGGISIHVNADKTEYMCFNQKGDISTLNGGSLKLVDKFTYLGSRVSSSKRDINMCPAKAWTAIDRLSLIWRSKLSVKIKHYFFLSSGCVIMFLYGCTT